MLDTDCEANDERRNAGAFEAGYCHGVSSPLDPLMREFLDRVSRGEWWSPNGRPEIPADWIRDHIVESGGGDRTVHPKGIRVRGIKLTGTLDLESASLRGPLLLDDVDVVHPIILERAQGSLVSITDSRLAGLHANQLRLKFSLDLANTKCNGQVTLAGAQIGGDLRCSCAVLCSSNGPALFADLIRVDGSAFLNQGFHADGEVRLLGAVIGSNLECVGGAFHNPGGEALFLDGIRVAGSMFLREEFQAEGEVRLLNATIGGNLDCFGGIFRNPDGDALSADGMDVGGSVYLRHGFHAEGRVRLLGAAIGFRFDGEDATFRAPKHEPELQRCALDCQGLTVVDTFVWRRVRHVAGSVRLVSGHVGALTDDPSSWQFDDMTCDLQGFQADRFTGSGAKWTWQQRKDWLDGAADSGPGRYEMVARWYRSIGRDHDARRIGIAKQDSRAAGLSGWRRGFHRLWRWLAAYGYQPWRAAGLLAGFYVLGVVVFSLSEMTPAQIPEVYGFNAWVYAADTVVPLVDLRQASEWAPGDWYGLWTMWTLIVAGWVLSLALVASVSRLYVRD